MPEKHIPGGYILLSRRLIESEIWEKPPLYLKVWIYILTKARHKPDKGFERGELLVSIPELQEACSHKVGFRKETPTKKQIFTILEWLRNPHDGNHGGNNDFRAKETMIGTTKTTRGMVVKVHNYNVYQEPNNYKKSHEGNAEGKGERTAEGERREREGNTIHNNIKNDENVNNSIYASGDDINSSYKHVYKSKNELQEQFQIFYNLYNKKKAKPKAEQAFKKALKKHDFETIMNGTREYLKSIRPENKQYQPYPASFLNQERYMDEHEPVSGNINDGGVPGPSKPTNLNHFSKSKDPLANVRHYENAID